jgi:transposase
MMILVLTAEEYRSTLALVAHTSDAKLLKRAQIALGLVRHVPPGVIARQVGCHRDTVYAVGHRVEQQGLVGLDDGRHLQRGSRCSAEFLAALAPLVDTSPRDHGWERGTWTLELLALEMVRRSFASVHPATLSRYLAVHAIVYRRARPTVVSPDPDKEAKLAAIAALRASLGPDERLFYEDEVDIHYNPKIGAQWTRKGVQPLVVTPGKNQKRYLAGAFEPATGEVVTLDSGRKNSDLFIGLLKGLCDFFPETRVIHIVVDNYIIHKSKRTLAAVAKLGGRVQLHFLPTYSPEHNPIERLWKELHDCVTRNHDAKTFADLLQRVEAFLDSAAPYPGSKPSVARAS